MMLPEGNYFLGQYMYFECTYNVDKEVRRSRGSAIFLYKSDMLRCFCIFGISFDILGFRKDGFTPVL